MVEECEQKVRKAEEHLRKVTDTVAGQEFLEKAADTMKEAGDCYRQHGAFEKAIEAYSRALEMHLKLGYDISAAKDYEEMAFCYEKMGKSEEFKRLAYNAAKIYVERGKKLEEMGNLGSAALSYANAAAVYKKIGERKQYMEKLALAAENFKQYGEMWCDEEDYDYGVMNLSWSVICRVALGEIEVAKDLVNRVAVLCEEGKVEEARKFIDATRRFVYGELEAKEFIKIISSELDDVEEKVIKEILL